MLTPPMMMEASVSAGSSVVVKEVVVKEVVVLSVGVVKEVVVSGAGVVRLSRASQKEPCKKETFLICSCCQSW